MTVYNVYGQRRTREVIEETWGHLKPEPNIKYYGWILVAYGIYGDIVIIDWKYDELEPSPWQHNDFYEFVNRWINRNLNKKPRLEHGIYLYTGWYKFFKNGNFQFQANPWIKQEIGVNHAP
jgi:hypothetical protein